MEERPLPVLLVLPVVLQAVCPRRTEEQPLPVLLAVVVVEVACLLPSAVQEILLLRG
jgi:hypothetical protein